jgi:hypothetical protein
MDRRDRMDETVIDGDGDGWRMTTVTDNNGDGR